ncbi:MAG: peptidase M19 [SAR202 cluster bacterium]|nr:peptidase M19 [SAR202 cluster bacterium]
MPAKQQSSMLIIDGDYPMAIGALDMARDLRKPIDEVRRAPRIPALTTSRSGLADVGTMATLPEMRKGRIAAALVKTVACVLKPGHPHGEFRSYESAYAGAMGQLYYYRILEKQGEAKILATSKQFADHMKIWESATDYEKLPVGFVIGMEGADAISWPDQVHEWHADGLRVISLSHYGVSKYSHGTGTGTDGGLTPDAKPLLKNMEKLGMILDVTHTSDASVRQEFEKFDGPALASHQNCRAIVPGERQQPDDILKEVIRRGGVIGSSMDTYMLNKHYQLNWASTSIPARRAVYPSELITIEDVADHVDYVCQLAGSSKHAAIGGDTDGQGGSDGAPHDVDTVADYQKLAGILEKRGYKRADIENVMYRNWQRFFEKWLGK